MQDLIVLLPGITGSVLRKHGKVAWGYSAKSIGTTLLTRGGHLKNALWLEHDDPAADDLDDGVTAEQLMPDLHLLPGLCKIDGYSAVSETLRAKFALKPNQNFFEFPYDWRRDNRVSARKLAQQTHAWLKAWRTQSPNAKVIFIAHSMGGLVARYFLEVMGGWRDCPTRALITFGTPFRGSLNALDSLANGMRKGPADLSELGRTFTALYQLLPIYPAYDPGDGKLVRVAEATGIPNVDPAKAKDALMFHDEIHEAVGRNRKDPKWPEQGYQIYPIVGHNQTTSQVGSLAGTTVEMLDKYLGKDLNGDGTVPRVSAIPREFDDVNQRGDMYAPTKHGSLQNAGAVLSHVEGRINDFYTDFGTFRAVAPAGPGGVTVSLEMEDLVLNSEPIRVRARASAPEPLRALLFRDTAAKPLQMLDLVGDSASWQSGTFEPMPAGHYRVEVGGARVVVPAQDAIAVADAAATDPVTAGVS